jgi:hypothetical protein
MTQHPASRAFKTLDISSRHHDDNFPKGAMDAPILSL